MDLIEMLRDKIRGKTSDVLYAISQGVKSDLEKKYLTFTFTTQFRKIKGRGHRVELVATSPDERGHQTLLFKIYFEGDKLLLVDDGFQIEDGTFDRRDEHDNFHTFGEYEYADPKMLDDLYGEIGRRFTRYA